MKKWFFIGILFLKTPIYAQNFITPYEKSNKTETATYFECISYYQQLAKSYQTIKVKTMGLTDAGYPLHLILFSKDKEFEPVKWHQQNKPVILINNGIHPGEPDGIDASMMLLRDIATNKIKYPANVVLAIIPVYNIGGSLNRTGYSRVNQDGPNSYGFRGNAQNLDLNRDFIKNDSRNAKSFAAIYHSLQPDIFLDNHVSDGADYQHTMTLLTTQHNKLGGEVGKFLHEQLEPALYKSMEAKNWPLIPYVNFFGANPDKGWDAFYDAPRYSSGYAALFGTIGFVSETHMLKPYPQRVQSTYDLMVSLMDEAGKYALTIKTNKRKDVEARKIQTDFPLTWQKDTASKDKITFMGYEAGKKKSEVTGFERLYYDRTKPFTSEVVFYNGFKGDKIVKKPKAYIIPQGWHAVIDLLNLNQVTMQRLSKDSIIEVEAYRIEEYKTSPRVFEKHYRQGSIKTSSSNQKIKFLKGDYIINTGQIADRFLVETLEPLGDDSYFSWNFFDAILQQKEGYSAYRWEDAAAQYLNERPELRAKLEEKKKADSKFAASAAEQLDFVYKNSPWYEPAHLRYPIYRLIK